jgi:hypothetical protein
VCELISTQFAKIVKLKIVWVRLPPLALKIGKGFRDKGFHVSGIPCFLFAEYDSMLEIFHYAVNKEKSIASSNFLSSDSLGPDRPVSSKFRYSAEEGEVHVSYAFERTIFAGWD